VIKSRTRPSSSKPRGQTLAEFALVLPVLILLLMAVFDVGRAVFLYTSLTNAAREGARLAIVNQNEAMIGERVEDMAFTGEVSNLGTPNLVSFYKQEPYNTDPATHAACAPIAVGCVAVVTVEANWTAITPIIGNIIGPKNFSAQSAIQIEFVCPNPTVPAYSAVDGSGCPKRPRT
jgi:Flp pilus assembly protein TadG